MSELPILLALLLGGSALASFCATAVVKHTAERAGLFDRPSDRKLHLHATPRLGGLAIVFGFAFPLLILGGGGRAVSIIADNGSYLFAMLASGSLILALGVYDDIVGANAQKKFTVQFAAAILLVSFGFHFQVIDLPFVRLDLGWFGMIASVLWIVGVINAFNFIDGIDSLAALVGIITAATIGFIAFAKDDALSLVVMAALGGSLAGFYYWNRPPAKIFMGDTGSLFIGLLFATVSLARPAKSPTAILIIGPMIALALPVLDALFVINERVRRGDLTLRERIVQIFSADQRHIHHILSAKYGSTKKAVRSIIVVTLLFSAAALLTLDPSTKTAGFALAALGVLALFVYRYLTTHSVRTTPRAVELPDSPVDPELHPQSRAS
jgi:UDP-GlcNAc:undecaprenyl-phosphate/decaprenyl-phosphate GlcNAc-1-phosphate transferase